MESHMLLFDKNWVRQQKRRPTKTRKFDCFCVEKHTIWICTCPVWSNLYLWPIRFWRLHMTAVFSRQNQSSGRASFAWEPINNLSNNFKLPNITTDFSLSLDDEQIFFRDLSKKLRSRSLEQLSSLAIWNCVPIVVSLEKGSRGLGFSVIDYQDPLHHKESVIVVR